MLIRHAEIPDGGLGQLSCQGLNHALLLPGYFKTNFPKPDYIFAPNPGDKVKEIHFDGSYYSYVRPLVTIEPTAIALKMPVNTEIGYTEENRFVNTLLQEKYHGATIFAAWEHEHLMLIAQRFLKKFGNAAVIPHWSEHDFNTVYVFTIDWNKKPATIDFKIKNQGFKNISTVCPD